MSKIILIVALSITVSMTTVSAGGAAANEADLERDLIVCDCRPPAQSLATFEDNRLALFGARDGESGESHVVKTGVWGSIKNGVKKAANAVGSAAKRAGVGVGSAVKKAAKAVARSPFGEGIKRTARNLKTFGAQAYKAGKKYLLHRS